MEAVLQFLMSAFRGPIGWAYAFIALVVIGVSLRASVAEYSVMAALLAAIFFGALRMAS